MRLKFFLFICFLGLPFKSFALGPASVYFGLSASALSASEGNFSSKNRQNFSANKAIGGFAGLRLLSLRFQGSAEYIPALGMTVKDSLINVEMRNYSLAILYDFSLISIIYPYVGIRVGHIKALDQSKDLVAGYSAGGILGIDLRFSDFFGIGLHYGVDNIAAIQSSSKSDITSLLHSVGVGVKFGF